MAVAALAAGVTACGDQEDGRTVAAGKPIDHVHGLDVDPADGALLIATHEGLFRSPRGSTQAERVGRMASDLMGFTVVSSDRFLASGHPAPGAGGEPHLGLIESSDGGASWRPVSLGGRADFHVLRHARGRIYGYNGLTGVLMVSDEGGKAWRQRRPPAPLIDLVADPAEADRLLASTERGLLLSEDAGRGWRRISATIGLLAWPADGPLYLVDPEGRVHAAEAPSARWTHVGAIGGPPAAFTSQDRDHLVAARADGGIVSSGDGGRSWEERIER